MSVVGLFFLFVLGSIMGHGFEVRLDALVAEVVETRRAMARLQARESRLLAVAVDLGLERMDAGGPGVGRDVPMREVAAELAAAMRVSDRTVQTRMGAASTLASRFADTLAAWESGRIDAGHVRVIVDAGVEITDDVLRARYEARVLEVAECESPGRLRAMARAVAASVASVTAEDRSRRAVADRCVRVFDLEDGMSRLVADGPTALIRGAYDRLTQMGRAVLDAAAPGTGESGAESESDDGRGRAVLFTGPGTAVDPDAAGEGALPVDSRTLDQVRADILTDLLLAGAPAAHGDGDGLAAITAQVQITVPALTLLGESSDAALLEGSGPIDAETARELTARAPSWSRVLTDPGRGHPVLVDRYRPSKKQRRFLAARDEPCRFPGCRMPVRRCDVDHTIDAADGGPTSTTNLAHLCRRHHVLKHQTEWTVRQHPGGVLEWRSPTGRTYTDRQPSTVRFIPTDASRPIDAGPPDDPGPGDPDAGDPGPGDPDPDEHVREAPPAALAESARLRDLALVPF